MEYRKAYEEYKKEHPEELVRLNALKDKSASIEARNQKAREEKIRRIEECRRILNGEQTLV